MRSTDLFTFAPWGFSGGCWNDAPRVERTAPAELRLVTWNVWFGDYKLEDRRVALFAELARRRADVIALQEVTPELLAALLEQPWVRADYQVSERHVFHYDVVILSRLPIRRIAVFELPSEMGRRVVTAELACGLAVATVHLESTREQARERARQLRIIQPVLAERYEDAVLVGDMNFEPGDRLETAALDPAFVDVWHALRAADPGYTVDTDINKMRLAGSPTPARKRIDRMFARGRRWRARSIELVGTTALDLDGTFTSDHFGLEVVISAA